MAAETDTLYMERALTLAQRGAGFTSPNPLVGAVVVRNGTIVGEGYHARAGGDHAEIVALRKAGSQARGATMYVSLEPCCHIGRTGPCTAAVIASRISRVVFAVKDPDPRVSGQGVRILKKAGVTVERKGSAEKSIEMNEGYFSFHVHHRPFVTLKTAQSVDGRIATLNGDSKWISGPESLSLAHKLRAMSDAVIVGMGTVRKDNPALTVRLVKGRNPYRIVVSRSLTFPRGCGLLRNNDDRKTIVASSKTAIQRFLRTSAARNVTCWEIELGRDGLIDLRDLTEKAGRFGLRSLLVEGGAQLATAMLREQLVDKYLIVIAPIVVGTGINSVQSLGVHQLTDATMFSRHRFEPCGRDQLFVGYPVKGVSSVHRLD